MSAWKKLLAAPAGGSGLDVDAVFNTTLYNGTSPTAQTITTGMDLDTEDGFLWIKTRSADASHGIVDTLRGPRSKLSPDLTSAATTSDVGKDVSAFTSTGFTLGADNYWNPNHANQQLVAWTFKKTPKFVDIVSYTGNGSTSRTIAHDLGCAIGMIVVKKVNSTSNWGVWHRGTGTIDYTGWNLNSTDSAGQVNPGYESKFTDSVFTPWYVYDSTNGSAGTGNVNGQAYIAYIFAHNDGDGEFGPDSDQDIIKCGSYTGAANNGVTIDLGFEPQFVMIKKANASALWVMIDNMRGMPSEANSSVLYPNTDQAEANPQSNAKVYPTPTGLYLEDDATEINTNGGTYVYMAIRRGSLFPPEAATEVFTPIAAGSDAALFNAPHIVDHGVIFRPAAGLWQWVTRLNGNKKLNSSETTTLSTGSLPDNLFGRLTKGLATSGNSDYVGLCWRRAPSVFDCVAYSGTGSNRTISHNLGVVPEMIWIKCTTSAQAWACYSAPVGNTHYQVLNTEALPVDNATYWNDTTPTDAVFSLGNATPVNAGNTGREFIAYLFASLAGVSKIGSYTGNGSNQNIDCGFSNGARFVMVKRISGATGPWWNWNTVSGLVAGNDNGMQFNADPQYNNVDSIDPYSGGFNIVQNGNVNANVNGASYLFYAIA